MKEKAWGWIEDNRERLIELSDKIWEHAELGLVEERSSKLLADERRSTASGWNVASPACPPPSSPHGVRKSLSSASWVNMMPYRASVTRRCPGRNPSGRVLQATDVATTSTA